MATVHDCVVDDAAGRPTKLDRYAGQVLLIVNTASQCGFTPQYAGLEVLQQTFSPRGFVVLAFPCNQFGHQEPGRDSDIANFCTQTYGVTFPLFAKLEVKGANASPLFRRLTRAKRGLFGTAAIKWNFTKFLVDRQGEVRRRFGPTTKPAAIAPAIEALI